MSLSVNIKKNLGDFQLDVAFESENEVLALLGASGCGKSVTLKCVAGIMTPDEGRIVLNGRVRLTRSGTSTCRPRNGGWAICSNSTRSFPI